MSSIANHQGIRVLLGDSHRLVRAALAQLIDSFGDIEVVAEGGSAPELLSLAQKVSAQVALIDASLFPGQGPGLMAGMLEVCPETQLVITSMYASDPFIRHTLDNGARGFIHKDAGVEDLKAALYKAAAGQSFIYPALESRHLMDPRQRVPNPVPDWDPLTERQRQVLRLVANGYRSKAIAEELGVSVKTVESHRAEIMNRLGVNHMAGLVQEAIRMGLVSG